MEVSTLSKPKTKDRSWQAEKLFQKKSLETKSETGIGMIFSWSRPKLGENLAESLSRDSRNVKIVWRFQNVSVETQISDYRDMNNLLK